MSRRGTYIWLTLVFAIFLTLAVYSFHKDNPLMLLLSEISIPVIYTITIIMISRSLKPIVSISRSLNLLREGDFSITLVKTGNKDVDNIIEVYNSMITRLREERLSVREKNHFLDLLIESSPLGIIVVDLDDRILDINKAAFRCLGLQETGYSGKKMSEFKSSLLSEMGKLAYEEKKLLILAGGQKYLCRKQFFMDHGFRHPFYIIEEFTEEIRQAEKEAYGKLIRMMAHEVNNTIGSVNSIMSTVKSLNESSNVIESDEIISMLGIAIQRNYQLNRFMQNLSNVVKLPPPERERLNLFESVLVVLESFNPVLKEKNIDIEYNHDSETLLILADRSQMELVFSNILKNSVEAIKENGSIKVTIVSNPLSVSFADDGTGLTKKATEGIFTPFFSTKTGGQGIGLTLIQEILTNHGYSFSLRNRKLGGAEFIILF
jgi:nitrogen fixation/metabolism regulation signal transduction histidine kinase